MKLTAIALVAVAALGSCSNKTVEYDEPADYAGCRQAAFDHKDQLGSLLDQVLADCAKKDPAGYEEWQKNQPTNK